jgi:hypothetical protein
MKHESLNSNLIVVINPVPMDVIRNTFPEHRIMTDAEFYTILNNGFFNGKPYTLDSIDELTRAIEDDCISGKKIIVHVFNPLIINFLEVDSGIENETEISLGRFVFYTKDKEFIPALSIPMLAKKLDILSIGEAVCDSLASSLQESYDRKIN